MLEWVLRAQPYCNSSVHLMKNQLIPIHTLSAILLYACGGQIGDTETDPPVDSEATIVEISPEDGFYLSELVSFTVDECEMEWSELLGILESDHGFQFLRTGLKVTMHLIQRGEVDDESFSCEQVEGGYTCHVMSESEDRGGEDHDAFLIRSMDVHIGWETNTDIAGLYTFYRECIGEDCEEFLADSNHKPQLPCETSLSITGAKVE